MIFLLRHRQGGLLVTELFLLGGVVISLEKYLFQLVHEQC